MRKITFHVEKGGTGKTTMAGSVGFALRRHGKVLMVDGDSQGNLSSWYLQDGQLQKELSDVMQGRCSLVEAILPVRENLDLLGTFAIGGDLKGWSETQLAGKPFAFERLSDQVADLGYDFLIFDLGPGISILEKSILAFVDEIVPTVAAEYFSADGLEIFEHELEQIRRDRKAAFVVKRLVVNRVNDSYTLHKAYRTTMQDLSYQTFTIHQSTGISDCVPEHLTVFEYDPKNRNLPVLEDLAGKLSGGNHGSKKI
ncbi:Sporulation initiation inhibitor protein Soj [subsurface metagenome]